jgi:hypothetical protein
MNALRTRRILPVAAVVALCLPAAAAAAAERVPAGNPAATQYTEAFPTAGGPRNAEGPQRGKGRPPTQVLGERNTRRLEAQGAAGREAAALAAETAPSPAGANPGGDPGPASKGGNADKGAGGDHPGNIQAPGNGYSSDGGSGLDEVLGQATGSSSGSGISPLLPLAILGAIVWSLAYLLRQRASRTE